MSPSVSGSTKSVGPCKGFWGLFLALGPILGLWLRFGLFWGYWKSILAHLGLSIGQLESIRNLLGLSMVVLGLSQEVEGPMLGPFGPIRCEFKAIFALLDLWVGWQPKSCHSALCT